jgi:hypothetical protein
MNMEVDEIRAMAMTVYEAVLTARNKRNNQVSERKTKTETNK